MIYRSLVVDEKLADREMTERQMAKNFTETDAATANERRLTVDRRNDICDISCYY